jgi:fatty acyl-ACP thioesterase B
MSLSSWQLFKILQETALNHVRTAGLLGDGFGATPEMSKRNLIWVVSKIQLLVEQYPAWYFFANLCSS